jgi:hypothetical protein
VFSSEDGVAVGELGRVCVVIWRDAVVEHRFERQQAGLADVVRRHRDGAGFLCVIEPTAAPPNDRLRRASIKMVESHGESLRCVAVVIEGEGFRAAITRSVISGMLLLLHSRTPVRVFSRVGEAVGWMQGHIRITRPETVMTDVEELRSQLDPFQDRS